MKTTKPTLTVRVNASEMELATRIAQQITISSDHQRQAEEIVARLIARQPDTMPGLLRVICGLPDAESAAGRVPRNTKAGH